LPNKWQNCIVIGLARFTTNWEIISVNKPVSSVSVRLTSGLLLLFLAAGCGRDDVKVYRVAKEEAPSPSVSQDPMQMGQMPDGHPDISGAMPRLTWKTPEGWTEVPPSGMRVASFSIRGADGKQADVSVVPLGGEGGGDVANVNRWRGQVGLQPKTPEELKKLAETVEVAGDPGELFDQAGKNTASGEDSRILAVIQHRDGTAWFFKMTGDDKLVGDQKSAFVEFLKSVKFAAPDMAAIPASQQPVDNMTLPAGHPDISGAAVAAEAPSKEGQPGWQVPADWKEVSGGQFLLAKFIVSGAGTEQTAVNVSTSAGDGGGLVANVNRWRMQLGLGGLSSDEITKDVKPLETQAGTATLVEMSGTDARSGQPAQLVAVVVPHAGQTWFYKLMGDSKVVASQKDAFTKFVQSVKY
jgi:hypothetical protein